MRSTCVCVLLLAVTSSSLASPLKQSQGEWIEQQSRKYDSLHGFAHGVFTMGAPAPPPPKSFDWRTKGVISPVQNQGELGNSAAIAAEECVESLNAISKGELVLLSIPEVDDCCAQRGQMPDNVFECIHNIGGLCSEATYPALTGHCRNGSCHAAVQIQGGKTVPAKQVTEMTEALLMNPLVVLVDASRTSFEMYEGGIYNDPDCSKNLVDHALQVVGYGEENGEQYWICKNSWGETWGEQGYIRIIKGVDMCGIESFASFPY